MAGLTDPRALLTALFDAAVARADPMLVVPPHLPPRPAGRLLVIGAGKASARMAEAAEHHYGPCDGLVLTRYGYARPCAGITVTEAAHPVPDQAGFDATRALLDRVAGLGPDDLVVTLISGGGSALLCAPDGGLTLADKQILNRALLASGAPISAMNVIRKRASAIKGGKLAAACAPARIVSLIISDVPGDDPAEIASGPTVGDDTVADVAALLDRYAIALPDHVRTALLANPGPLPSTDPRLSRNVAHVVAAPRQSLDAAAALARASGITVHLLGDALEGEARTLAADHAHRARAIADDMTPASAPVLLLSGGECTVTRRGDGVGGPNAEFALAAAIALNGHPRVHLIACDTDGVDGAAEVAGAYVGPDTLDRAASCGVDAGAALDRNDAHTFFAAVADQIITGPTLTNVNDFRALLILPPHP
ncbi:glycerate kinase [Loktanella sp. SALINAS62]|uniref:glycerate kinase type-2 family protein n=1 Tax=Loktanella sp. SALINAS62 TaxID=2706124 RepID=UPI001B8AAC2F|nr:glycerate kinase [Loktanella sp. SALINAS62]MBS1301139.1 glycerate kinase [Loktanella sp. SALINAS62]